MVHWTNLVVYLGHLNLKIPYVHSVNNMTWARMKFTLKIYSACKVTLQVNKKSMLIHAFLLYINVTLSCNTLFIILNISH